MYYKKEHLGKIQISLNKKTLIVCDELHMKSDKTEDVRIKTMFGSSLPPVVCRRAHVFLCMSAYNDVNIFFLS